MCDCFKFFGSVQDIHNLTVKDDSLGKNSISFLQTESTKTISPFVYNHLLRSVASSLITAQCRPHFYLTRLACDDIYHNILTFLTPLYWINMEQIQVFEPKILGLVLVVVQECKISRFLRDFAGNCDIDLHFVKSSSLFMKSLFYKLWILLIGCTVRSRVSITRNTLLMKLLYSKSPRYC